MWISRLITGKSMICLWIDNRMKKELTFVIVKWDNIKVSSFLTIDLAHLPVKLPILPLILQSDYLILDYDL